MFPRSIGKIAHQIRLISLERMNISIQILTTSQPQKTVEKTVHMQTLWLETVSTNVNYLNRVYYDTCSCFWQQKSLDVKLL